jgi:hypothetical protein
MYVVRMADESTSTVDFFAILYVSVSVLRTKVYSVCEKPNQKSYAALGPRGFTTK